MAHISSSYTTRARGSKRVLQFGSGALLRGLIDPIIAEAAGARTITVVQSSGGARAQAMTAQQGLYTFVCRGVEAGETLDTRTIIDSVDKALVATEQWDEVLEAAAAAPLDIIVSNTTEAGLKLDDADGDLATGCPKSFPAKLTRVLFEQYKAGPERPPVVLPCELIEDAHVLLRNLCIDAATKSNMDAKFISWLANDVPFCSTLVDRICTSPATDSPVRTALGYDDELVSVVEPFTMWAIEASEPVASRLIWLTAAKGVEIHDDISPVRDRKVRILNGAHTASVPVALLAGHMTVLDMMNDPALRDFVKRTIWNEILPYVSAPDSEAFANAVLDRFANPFVEHHLRDITAEHVTKVTTRLAPTLIDYTAAIGTAPTGMCLGIASFLALAKGEEGTTREPKASVLCAHWEASNGDWYAYANAVFTDDSIGWGVALGEHTDTIATRVGQLGAAIEAEGIVAAVSSVTA